MAIPSVKHRRAPARAGAFKSHFSTCEAIATLLHPYAEVILHDLRTERIIQVWNCFTARKAGDLSRLSRAQDLFAKDQAVLGPYEKALESQGRTKSVTAALRDSNGELIGFLCINLDVTLADKAVAMLASFASPQIERPETAFRNDVKQHVNYVVRDYSLNVKKPIDNLTRAQRVELISMMQREGLFQTRNSVMIVATAMKISRASVYNLIAEAAKSIKGGVPEPVSKSSKPNGRSARRIPLGDQAPT